MFSRTSPIPADRPVGFARGQVLTVPVRPGDWIDCRLGRLWITQEGDQRDIFVQAGGRFVFDRRCDAVVHALRDSTVVLHATAPGSLTPRLRALFVRQPARHDAPGAGSAVQPAG